MDHDANDNLLTKSDPIIAVLLASIERVFVKLESMGENYRPVLNGERYLTDKELSERLKISRRALQTHRNAGMIPYYLIGGKILYLESDIEKILETNYRQAFNDL